MANVRRPLIAVNEETGERVRFDRVADCTDYFGVKRASVLHAVAMGSYIKGWRIYDTPEKLREKIEEIKKIIKKLEK